MKSHVPFVAVALSGEKSGRIVGPRSNTAPVHAGNESWVLLIGRWSPRFCAFFVKGMSVKHSARVKSRAAFFLKVTCGGSRWKMFGWRDVGSSQMASSRSPKKEKWSTQAQQKELFASACGDNACSVKNEKVLSLEKGCEKSHGLARGRCKLLFHFWNVLVVRDKRV